MTERRDRPDSAIRSSARAVTRTPPRRFSGQVRLERPAPRHEQQFLNAVRRSRSLHEPWVYPPATRSAYRSYLERAESASCSAFLVCLPTGELVGVINVNDIIGGALCCGHLGYYAFLPFAGMGAMRVALAEVVRRSFRELRLHRLEANIQPNNQRSRALAKRLHFRFEGLAKRFLKIGGSWKDHERWALTVEEWQERQSGLVSGAHRITER